MRKTVFTAWAVISGLAAHAAAAEEAQQAAQAQDGAVTQAQDAAQDGAQAESARQRQVAQALHEDILFERQRRQLSNELALERLRDELLKLRAERTPGAPAAAVPAADSVPQGIPEPAVLPGAEPQVVLVSQVAGVWRAGVMAGGSLLLVGPGETFSAGGRKYRLVRVPGGLPVAREAR